MNKVFVISDTHFLHNKIVEYQGRPQNHNELMFKNWNSVVDKDDLVIHCGDLSAGVGKHENGFEKLKKICLNLNGRKVLLRGNHDHFTNEQYNELGFEGVHDTIIMGHTLFCHYPPKIDEWTKDRYKPLIENIIARQKLVRYVIHGHSHSTNYPNLVGCFNATVERINYTPILVEDIECELESKRKENNERY